MRVAALLALAAPAMAALVTTTFTWVDGNTVVLSIATDADGDAVTKTVSTIDGVAAGDAAATTTATTTSRGATTTKGAATHTTATTATQLVNQAAPTTTAAPMHTTTYWYEGSDGVWVEATWSASFVAPTVATVVVPAGSIQDYNQYQSSANSLLYAAAVSSNAAASSGERAAVVGAGALAGWTAMAVGMAGAAWGLGRM